MFMCMCMFMCTPVKDLETKTILKFFILFGVFLVCNKGGKEVISNLCPNHGKTESEFVNLLSIPGIDSQPWEAGTTTFFAVPVRQAT